MDRRPQRPYNRPMVERDGHVVVGIDNGGTKTNATILEARPGGRFLVDRMHEVPSRVADGPAAAVEAMVEAMEVVLRATGIPAAKVLAIGLDTPGPASADGVISSRGATNFSQPAWRGFDIRHALSVRLGLPVVYANDGNAAALYAHHVHFGARAMTTSSVSAIVGTGLGGGVVEAGRPIRGVAGQAGELGHIRIPLDGVLADGQPMPTCACGNAGDVESVASLTGIARNLLPYWLTRFPDHPLAGMPPADAAKAVRAHGEAGDALARSLFEQQAAALGRLFTVVANVTDPAAYFVGGGVVEADPAFREWFVARVRAHTVLRDEQAALAAFALVPDRDMAGARGSALAALELVVSGATSPPQ
jgi:predicted NBD/HSP70 family sugar kinase